MPYIGTVELVLWISWHLLWLQILYKQNLLISTSHRRLERSKFSSYSQYAWDRGIWRCVDPRSIGAGWHRVHGPLENTLFPGKPLLLLPHCSCYISVDKKAVNQRSVIYKCSHAIPERSGTLQGEKLGKSGTFRCHAVWSVA